MNEHRTDELNTPVSRPDLPEHLHPGTTRFIDINIYDMPTPETEDVPTVESSAHVSEPLPQDETGQEELEHSPPLATPIARTPRRSRPPLVGVAVLVACVGTAIGIALYALLPMFGPTATVTIIPVTRQVSTTATIALVTGTVDPAKQQVPGRALSSVSMSQQATATATGTAHQDARLARGFVTFYNGAPSQQTVTAGTLLTGTDGTQIVTDVDAQVPAVAYPTLGQTTVSAHALLPGPGGNIRAGDIYGPCCRANVSAVNAAFTGGQDARTYQTVTQGDIDKAVNSLKTSLDQSSQAAFQTQVHANETLLTPLSCTIKATSDHHAGDEATHAQITIAQTCSGIAYASQAYHDLLARLLTQEAGAHLGDGYQSQGDPQARILTTTPKDKGTTVLQVTVTGNYGYQFTLAAQTHIKTLVAGMSKTEAVAAVLKVPGVQSASITTTDSGLALPTNTDHIHIAFIVM